MTVMSGIARDLVRRARLSRQLTMAALARLADVPTSTVSRIEAGKTEPTVAMVARLVKAAGFQWEQSLSEAGSDQPFADLLGQLQAADVDEREALLDRMPSVASVAPVARRTGARRVGLPGDLASTVDLLERQDQHPVVSGLEAFAGAVEPLRSFIPVVHVDEPARVQGFGPAGPSAFQPLLLLPTTANVRRWVRDGDGVAMVAREWGLLDAMASPGRQGDIAREELAWARSAMA